MSTGATARIAAMDGACVGFRADDRFLAPIQQTLSEQQLMHR